MRLTFPHGLFQTTWPVKFMSQLLKAPSCWVPTTAPQQTPASPSLFTHDAHAAEKLLASTLLHIYAVWQALREREALNKMTTVLIILFCKRENLTTGRALGPLTFRNLLYEAFCLKSF